MARLTGQHRVTVTGIQAVGAEDKTDPTVTFTQEEVSLQEDDATGTAVTVELSAVQPQGSTVVVPLSVDALATDTATRGVDYELRQGPSLTSTPLSSPTISIPAGETSATFYVTPLDQSATQAPEVTLTITLVTTLVEGGQTYLLQGATLGATTTLTGYLATVGLPVPLVRFPGSITSFDEPSVNTTREIPVQITGPAPSGGVTVEYTLDPTTSPLGIWTETSSSPLTWAEGDDQPKNITFTHVSDIGTYNGDELLGITLGSPSGAELGSNTTFTVVWREADAEPGPTPEVGFVGTSSSATEGGESIPVSVQVLNGGSIDTDVTVNWQVDATSTAQAGTHYSISGSSPLVLSAGQPSGQLTVAFPDNDLDQANTTLVLTITSVTGGGTLDSSRDTYTITIADDDVTAGAYDPDGVDEVDNLDHTGASLAPRRTQVDEDDWDLALHPNGYRWNTAKYPSASPAVESNLSDPVSAVLIKASEAWDALNPTLTKATATMGSENNSVVIHCVATLLDALGNETQQTDYIQQAGQEWSGSFLIHPFTQAVRNVWTTAQTDVGYPVIRDIVFVPRVAGALAPMHAWFINTTSASTTGSGVAAPILLDNVRFERIQFTHRAPNPTVRCFHMPGFTMPGDETGQLLNNQHGTIKIYDCRFMSTQGGSLRPQIFMWCEARANWDIRQAATGWRTFGPGNDSNHYHNLYLYSPQPLAGKGNYFIGLDNDAANPPIRTFMQVVNRRKAVPGRGTSGELVFLNITGSGIGGGTPGGSFLTVWGNNGRVYFRNCALNQDSVSRTSGGLLVCHEYDWSTLDHPRDVYPLQLETDRWYTTDEVVVHNWDLNSTNVDGRYPMQFIGVQTVRLIDFDHRGIGNSAAQISLNNQQNNNSNTRLGFWAGLCFTKELVVSGLLHPDTGDSYVGALSAYPGWGTTTKGSDGYHQNWWQDLGSKRDLTTDAAIDAWPDIVGEQYTNRLASSGDGLGTITDADWPGSDTPTLPSLTLSQIGDVYLAEPADSDVEYSLAIDWEAETMLDIRTQFEVTGDLTEDVNYTIPAGDPYLVPGKDPNTSIYAATEWTDPAALEQFSTAVVNGRVGTRNFRLPVPLTMLSSAPALTTGTKSMTMTLEVGGQGPQVEYPRGSGTWVNCPTGTPNSDTLYVVPLVDMPTPTFGLSGQTTVSATSTEVTVFINRNPVVDGSTSIPSGTGPDGLDLGQSGLQLASSIVVGHSGTATYTLTNSTASWAAGEIQTTLTLTGISAQDGDTITLQLWQPGATSTNLQDTSFSTNTWTITFEGAGNPTTSTRSEANVVADYTFYEQSGNVLHSDGPDSAPSVATTYDLTLSGSAYNWGVDPVEGNYLEITGETTASNGNPFNPFTGTFGEFWANTPRGYTVEVWIDAANLTQGGPARIVGIPDPSDPAYKRNLMLGQKDNGLELRARDTVSGDNGSTPDLEIESGFTTGLVHLVGTVSADGDRVLYSTPRNSDGWQGPVASNSTGGNASNWDQSFPLVLFNELLPGTRYWLGKVYRVVLHDTALTESQVAQNWASGPQGADPLPPPTASLSTTTVGVGEWEGSKRIQVQLDLPASQSVQVPVTLALGQASLSSGGSLNQQTYTILQNEQSVDVDVFLTDNTSPTLTVGTLSIDDPTGDSYLKSETLGSSTWTVLSNDATPSNIQWTTPSQYVGTGAGAFEVGVEMAAEYHTDVTVDVTVSGTADGSDYNVPGSQITIPANTRTATFTVEVMAGEADDGQTIILTMSNPSEGSLGVRTETTLTLSALIGAKPGPGNSGVNNSLHNSWHGGPQTLTDIPSFDLNDNYLATSPNVQDLGGGTYLIANKRFGVVDVEWNNISDNQVIIIRNCDIQGPTLSYGVRCNFGVDNTGCPNSVVQVEHCDIHNCGDGVLTHAADLDGGHTVVQYCNVYEHGGDGFKGNRAATYRYNWIHHCGVNPGAHADGIQIESAGGPLGNITVEYNNFDMPVPESDNGPGSPYASNAAILCFAGDASSSSIQMERVKFNYNWCNGGNYTMYYTIEGGGTWDGLEVIGNQFGRDFRWGIVAGGGSAITNREMRDNRWEDTQMLVLPTTVGSTGTPGPVNPETGTINPVESNYNWAWTSTSDGAEDRRVINSQNPNKDQPGI